MKWNNLGTYTWNALGTWTWDTLDNFTDGYEQIFTDRDNVSANYTAELAKLTGASPHYKVFIEDANGTIDLQFASFERLVTTPEISRSLERLFQETQISSIGLNVDNTDDYFNPMGTGLFAVSSVYNKPIKVWKGFRYGWNGSKWGTAEYIPAFTGYIDNIQQDSQGHAVINARDKGKVFYTSTTENCTQSGTAGGAYWINESITENVEHLLLQSAKFNGDYNLDLTYLIDKNGTKHVSIVANDTIANGVVIINNNSYIVSPSGCYSFNGYGTAVFLGTFNAGTLTEGTNIYGLVDSNRVIVKYNPVTNIGTTLTGVNSQGVDFMAYSGINNSIYFNQGTNKHFINASGGTIGTLDTVYSTPGYTIMNMLVYGTHLFTLSKKTVFDQPVGTYHVQAVTIPDNLGDGFTLIDGEDLPGSTGFLSDRFTFGLGTYWMESRTDTGAVDPGRDTGTICKIVWTNGAFDFIVGGNYSGTLIKNKFYSPLDNLVYYTANGTLWGLSGTTSTAKDTIIDDDNALILSEINTTSLPQRLFLINNAVTGTTLLQYSSMYVFTIGTFVTGRADKVADVLQELSEASNYIQYIDEGGVYYFKRRDSGTAIDYTFGTNDIVDLQIAEGEGVSQSPIINKGVWGTNTGTVSYEDLPSQGTYGVQTYSLSNKWIIQPILADDVLYGLVNDNKQPKAVITAKLRYYPIVKLFDVVSLDYSRLNLSGTKPWQVVGMSENNINTTLTLKEV